MAQTTDKALQSAKQALPRVEELPVPHNVRDGLPQGVANVLPSDSASRAADAITSRVNQLVRDVKQTPVLPTGIIRKQVEILADPYHFEELPTPGDINLGPAKSLPSNAGAADRRRSDAGGNWQPMTVKPF